MTPYLHAHAAYHLETPGIVWSDMLTAHLHSPNAWIISTPKIFIAARRVSSTWPDNILLHPSNTLPAGDALHIYIAAGGLAEILAHFPTELRGEIKCFTFQRQGYRIHKLPAWRIDKRTPP